MIDIYRRVMARNFDHFAYFQNLQENLQQENAKFLSEDLYQFDICLHSSNREFHHKALVMNGICEVLNQTSPEILDP